MSFMLCKSSNLGGGRWENLGTRISRSAAIPFFYHLYTSRTFQFFRFSVLEGNWNRTIRVASCACDRYEPIPPDCQPETMVKKIGKYELGKTLGKGTFSKVKYGVDVETNQASAIKIIDKQQLAKEHMEEQLKREIAIMKHLKHENIVQLKEVCAAGHPWSRLMFVWDIIWQHS